MNGDFEPYDPRDFEDAAPAPAAAPARAPGRQRRGRPRPHDTESAASIIEEQDLAYAVALSARNAEVRELERAEVLAAAEARQQAEEAARKAEEEAREATRKAEEEAREAASAHARDRKAAAELQEAIDDTARLVQQLTMAPGPAVPCQIISVKYRLLPALEALAGKNCLVQHRVRVRESACAADAAAHVAAALGLPAARVVLMRTPTEPLEAATNSASNSTNSATTTAADLNGCVIYVDICRA